LFELKTPADSGRKVSPKTQKKFSAMNLRDFSANISGKILFEK
jgi:hypothetical protein